MNFTADILPENDEPPGPSVFAPSEYFVSNEVQKMAEIAIEFCLSFVIALSGIVSNIMVILVFAKQGYKDSMNISMTTIAIWDLVKCLAAAMQRMAGPWELIDEADAKSWSNICVVAFSYLICFSSYVSSVLAAFVAVERCLCVSMPFKVREIITPKVTLIVCVVSSVVVFGAFVVMWSVYDIVKVFHPGYNQSIFIYRYNDFFYKNGGPIFKYYNLSGIIWPFISFVVINVCTVIIVYHLRKSSSFRMAGLGNAADHNDGGSKAKLSKRDRQVVKMLLVIIVVYIISLAPRIITYLVKYFVYEYYFLRLYHNLFTIIGSIIFFLDIFNASVNLYIFLFMSSGFRCTFISIFPLFRRLGYQGERKHQRPQLNQAANRISNN